ncbi:MAG: SRPBCC family protein [Pseudomonadota bacterium]|nr:SRPBCC family protein [Pseudomonadota bacterium]
MMYLLRTLFCLLFATAAPVVHADIKAAASDGFLIVHSARIDAGPAQTYALLPAIGRWWSSSHTYSGDAANLTLDPQAGGCFCERWKDGAVVHGRVILTMRDQMMRIETALGPLQSKAVTGVLTFQLVPDGNATVLTLAYRVNGASGSALDKDAPAVERVLGEQLARLVRLAETGKADASAP